MGAALAPSSLKLHPLNTDFSWPMRPREGLESLPPSLIDQYNRDGWLKVPGLIQGKALETLRIAIDHCEASEPDSVLTMADGYTLTYAADKMSFSRNLVARDETVRAFALSAAIKALMQDLIGPKVRLYWDQAVYKKPGEPKEFPFHQDNGYTFLEPQAYVTLWLALVDATEANGCPWVMPGLHTLGTLAHENAPYGLEVGGIRARDGALCCEAKAGDAVIFSSLTPHRTGPNLTASTRKALILQYIPDGAAVQEANGTTRLLNDPVLNPVL